MVNFGALKYFGSIIKKLKKSLYSINHVIYICDASPLGHTVL